VAGTGVQARAFVLDAVRRTTHTVVQRTIQVTPRDDLLRLGTAYGGWWVPAGCISSDSIVYSAGLGEDASFDLELISRFGCQVWAMDPTPRSIEFAQHISEPRFHFLPFGVWGEEAELQFYAPANPSHVSHSALNIQRTSKFFTAQCLPVRAFMDQLGHDRLDLLKLNIEGAEGPVLDAMLDDGLRPKVLCVGFDAVEAPWRLRGRLRRLEAAHYVVCKVARRSYTLMWKEPLTIG
jgi:FkbM family methyltransferase